MSPKVSKKTDFDGGVTEAVDEIRKRFGDGAIMKMSDDFHAKVTLVSTGVASLDLAIGGGLPLGRIIEVFGPESSGKSTLALSVVAQAQSEGIACAYIDTEHAMDPVYAEAVGVDVGELLFSQPDTGEEALEIVEMLCASGGIGVSVVDSVATLTPRAEIEGEMGDAHVGLMARMMSQGLRKLNGVAAKNGTMILFINQLREKIGVIYGSPEVTPGGRALKFYSSVRLDVRKIETLKTEGEATSNKTRVKVVKNKIAPPFKQAEFEVEFGKGVDKVKDLLNVAVDMNIVAKSGNWYTIQGEQVGNGINQAKANVLANPEMLETIRKAVKEAVAQPSV